jgi:PKD repeat protein
MRVKMKNSILLLTLFLMVFTGCKKEDTTPPDPVVKSRFTVTNDDYDGFKISIKNDSQEATSYLWDFGDGNTGTQSDSVFSYTYAEAGTYTITLTAKNGTITDVSSKEVVISGMTFRQFLGGNDASGKVWNLEWEAGVVMLNPDNYGDWWYSWTKHHGFPLDQRNTVRHHNYIFKPDGTFEFQTEGWTIRPGFLFGDAPDPKGWPDDSTWMSSLGTDCSTWGNNSNLTYEIGEACGIADEELEVALIAAWFHDTGMTEKYQGHEEVSKKLARQFLEARKYDGDKTSLVLDCIEATKIPKLPCSVLQGVLCDADMIHLSCEHYLIRLALLRKEWVAILNRVYPDVLWYTMNLTFLKNHKYHTAGIKHKLNERKKKNIEVLSELIRNTKN